MHRKLMAIMVTLLVTLLAMATNSKPVLPTVLFEAKPVSATVDVFETGKFSTNHSSVGTSDPAKPPKPLLIVRPTVNGTYPVILFYPGTSLFNYFYTDLFEFISSHGYIVVSPQLYVLVPPCGPVEVMFGAEVANWLPSGLQSVLPENITADLGRLAIGGHSRGGKAAFAIALGYSQIPIEVNISALVGLAPVAGISKYWRTKPEILKYVPGSFNLSIPVTVIGTGLGDKPKFIVACAPDGVNHKEFFYECRPQSSHFVATDYGHLDMLNDNLGIFGPILDCICKRGTGSKELMRRTVGGIIVSFLKAYFEGESIDYFTILHDPSVAPAKLDPVQFLGARKYAQI